MICSIEIESDALTNIHDCIRAYKKALSRINHQTTQMIIKYLKLLSPKSLISYVFGNNFKV